ncbi:MAG: hypothetical protein IKT94_02350 [Rikenellaceae bacterium]|nr:hypothetical protein [Rikenellaceae bacterium]
MKRLLLLIALCSLFGGCESPEPEPEPITKPTLTTTAITNSPARVLGRTATNGDGSISFDWCGVYVDIRFSGSYLAIKLSDTGRNYLNIWVDGKKQTKLATKGSNAKLILFDNPDANGEHLIRIQKATEGDLGRITLHSITTNGSLLSTTTLKRPHHIEFYGDSYTCGYGTESDNPNDPFTAETENCYYTYAAMTADHFGADYSLIAHSGCGVVRNYGDKEQVSNPTLTMSSRAFRTYDNDANSKWNFNKSTYRPDALVIALSTNDFSTSPHPSKEQFAEGYHQFIEHLRAEWGNDKLPILCVLHSGTAADYVQDMIDTMPYTEIVRIPSTIYDYKTDYGASYHPNRSGQTKMSKYVIEGLAELTGWK